MKLIAQKPCSFGGKRFYIGDEIPTKFVLNPIEQQKLGNISIVTVETVEVVLHAEEGDLSLNLTHEGLQSVVDVLTSKADAAKAIVEQMTDDDALILLYATDSRKNIQQAAQARAKALDAEEAEPEESDPEENDSEENDSEESNSEESAGEQ